MNKINIEPELINYIKERILLGYPEYDTRKNLLMADWSSEQIEDAIKFCTEEIKKEPKTDVVDEQFLNGWSISSIVLGPIYFFCSHLKKTGFLWFIPLFGFYLQIFNFFKGRRKSYETGKWASFEKFEKKQRLLDLWSFVIMINFLIIFMIGMISLIFYPDVIEDFKLRVYEEKIIYDFASENIDKLYEESTDAFKVDYPNKDDLLRFLKDHNFSNFESDFVTIYKNDAIICGYQAPSDDSSTEIDYYDNNGSPLNLKLFKSEKNGWVLDKIDTKIGGCNLENYVEGTENLEGNPLSKFFPEEITINKNKYTLNPEIRKSEVYTLYNSYGSYDEIDDLENSIWTDYLLDENVRFDLIVANYSKKDKEQVKQKVSDYISYYKNYFAEDIGYEVEVSDLSSKNYELYYTKRKSLDDVADKDVLAEILFIDSQNNIFSGSIIYANDLEPITPEDLDTLADGIMNNIKNN